MPNRTTEDYIKAIYAIGKDGGRATTSALADHLKLADASVTDMLKKLSERGLATYERYQGAFLTAPGRRMALKIVRRHRLWEMFLVRHLGYSWDKVHSEAERLEHVTSDELEDRLDMALDYPTADPHGDPIPSASGTVPALDGVPLAEVPVGRTVMVRRVSDRDGEILQHATSLGIALETPVRVKERRSFDGSMMIEVADRDHFVSRMVAEAIFVAEQGEPIGGG
jgi:DtxR family Mn-dependent transcriptional regulator